MAGNTFGKIFCITSFGESHGECVGGVIDGCPSNIKVDYALLNKKIKARQTNNFHYASSRKEDDEVIFISGIYDGITTGSPIAFYIKNNDIDSSNYEENKGVFKPSHADFTYLKKYGISDYKGSGRASARETIVRIVGGCFAMMFLNQFQIKITAYTSQIGKVKYNGNPINNLNKINENNLHCPDLKTYEAMLNELESAKEQNDSVGGRVNCIIENPPVGLGEPVFDKLSSDLAKAMLSINAAKGFEYGSGFEAASMRGSQHNDLLSSNFRTITNHSGGIQAGISNGETIYFSVAFKPIASIRQNQDSVNTQGEKAIYKGGGRHDICVIPRVLPVVEAMAALVMADHILRFNAYKFN
ncbi:MAG TPA: chorismate synthase [Bacteroidales bacterium]|jgi:chorismate synthase|nr:chorismate synthase [Bacteroidales bacterium]